MLLDACRRCSRYRELAERMGDVVGGGRGWLGRWSSAAKEAALVRHAQNLLEIFERFGELRRAQMEHRRDILRLARLPALFQRRIDARGHDGCA